MKINMKMKIIITEGPTVNIVAYFLLFFRHTCMRICTHTRVFVYKSIISFL